MLIPAAAAAAIVALIIGISTGGHGQRFASIHLRGTAFAPQASATLEILPAKAGKQPMRLTETGLPKLQQGSRYVVYLVRNGRTDGSCGSFVVTDPAHGLTVRNLDSPYRLKSGDTWIVKEEGAALAHGVTVLEPATA